MISAIDRLREVRAVRAVLAAVLALALMVPSALLGALPRMAWAADGVVTVTTTVDGLADGTLPVLTSGKDFTAGKAVNADPVNYTADDGSTPLADLVASKAKQGKEIKWTDADTGKAFSWSSTKITKSTKVKGTWTDKKCSVTVNYNDRGATSSKTVSGIAWGKAYTSVAKAPADPTREGYEFDGWVYYDDDSKSWQAFDFDKTPVKENMTVKATWHLSDAQSVTPESADVHVGDVATGRCWIGSTWSVHPAKFDITWFSGDLEGCSGEGECSLASAAQPTECWGDYTATVTSVDIASGLVTYSVSINPNDDEQDIHGAEEPYERNAYGIIGYQTISMTASVHRSFGGYLEIDKSSANTDITENNDCYNLEGAEYGVYAADGSLRATLTTDENGVARSDLLAAGDYTVKETKAPKGYALDEESHAVTVPSGSTAKLGVSDEPQNDPVLILLGKYDSETAYNTEANLPKGSASLAGAQFTVEYYDGYYDTVKQAEASGEPTRSWTYATDADGFIKSSDDPVSGDELYKAGSITTLPLGTVVIKETKAPEGYNLPQPFGLEQSWVRQITSDGSLDTVSTYNAPTVAEPVERGDVSFRKVDEDQNAMANVLFKLTSKTTGESHVIVTDENGYASTKSSWNSHASSTNGNDWLLSQGTEPSLLDTVANAITGKALDASCGVWFNGLQDGQEGSSEPDDSRGALPYDTYELEELSCSANSGKALVTKTFRVYRDSTYNDAASVDLGTVTDWNVSIGTTATDKADGDKKVCEDQDASITDKVHCKGLRTGDEYTLTATLMDKSTGEQVKDSSGNAVTATKTFTATDTEQDVDIDLAIGECGFSDGQEVVVFESLAKDGVEQAAHDDLSDEGQTVTVVKPTGSTQAHGEAAEDKTILTSDTAVVVDTVSYENLVVGKEYTVTGALMDKSTGKALADASGNSVTASTKFTPVDTYGTVDVTFEFDASLLGGKEVVAFEKCTRNGKDVFSHEDISDDGQTVTVVEPKGSTTAKGSDGEKSVVASSNTTVVDTVSYENLVVGKEYTVTGTLRLKSTDEEGNVTDAGALKDADGNTVTASAKFTPVDTYGTVDVTFGFDASLLGGKEVVAFERVSLEGKTIYTHEDISDEGQTVSIGQPEIGTKLLDGLDSDSSVIAGKSQTVVDTVSYENLIAGGAYTVYTMLMDSETGLPLVVGDGAYTADQSELLAFSQELMAALNLSDADEKAASGSETAKDEPGETGSASAAAMPKKLKADASKSIDSDALAKAFSDHAELAKHLAYGKAELTPEKSSGEAKVELEADFTAAAGKTTTCYEVLAVDGKVPCVHTDLTDEDQQVKLTPPTIGTELVDSTDSDHYILPSTETKLVDTVSYTGLVPGKEYRMSLTLMDKTTGKELTVGDKPVTAQVSFTPNEQEGKVEVEVTFDSTGLADGSVTVAFEECSIDSVVVAEHKDIDDEAQSVTMGVPPDGTAYDKTGVDLGIGLAVAAALAASAAFLGWCAWRARRAED